MCGYLNYPRSNRGGIIWNKFDKGSTVFQAIEFKFNTLLVGWLYFFPRLIPYNFFLFVLIYGVGPSRFFGFGLSI